MSGPQDPISGKVKTGSEPTLNTARVLDVDALYTDADLLSHNILYTARSVVFNIDNGAGTTIDSVIIKPSQAITITRVQIVYVTETTGTVAAGNVRLGTALGGAQIVGATAYENSKAVGTSTACSIVSPTLPANTALFVRHTGVAAVAAGEAYVEIEYRIT